MSAYLLSIKPVFVNDILSNIKKVEFRKNKVRIPIGSTCYIYSTSPVKKVVARFKLDRLEYFNLSDISKFDQLHNHDLHSLLSYYNNTDRGSCLFISDLEVYEQYLSLHSFNLLRPPQSYCKITCPQCVYFL